MADTYKTFVVGAEVSPAIGGVSQLVTDLAVVVADGASPTQAHVTTVAEDVSVLLGGGATNVAGGATQAALLVVVDTTAVPTVSVLRTLFNRVLKSAASSGLGK